MRRLTVVLAWALKQSLLLAQHLSSQWRTLLQLQLAIRWYCELCVVSAVGDCYRYHLEKKLGGLDIFCRAALSSPGRGSLKAARRPFPPGAQEESFACSTSALARARHKPITTSCSAVSLTVPAGPSAGVSQQRWSPLSAGAASRGCVPRLEPCSLRRRPRRPEQQHASTRPRRGMPIRRRRRPTVSRWSSTVRLSRPR